MTRKLSKEEIKDKFDGEELDLSLCNLAKVPVREMVGLHFSRPIKDDFAYGPRTSFRLCCVAYCKFGVE